MNNHRKRAGLTSCFAAACALALSNTASADVVWQDDDPLSGTSITGNGLAVTNINTPVTDATVIVPAHPTAGQVDQSAIGGQYSNISNSDGPFAVDAGNHGQNFTMSIDYNVPSNTVMANGDTFYLSVKFTSSTGLASDGITFADGYITDAAAGGDWGSIVVTDIVPAVDGAGQPIDTVTPLLVFADTGFSMSYVPEATPGESFYIDEICFEANTTDNVAQATVKLWQDDDPLSGSSTTGNGLAVTNINTPVTDATVIVPAHPTAGQVDQSAIGGQYSNISNSVAPFGVSSANHGLVFTHSIDYNVPSNTVMANGDTFYLSVSFTSSTGLASDAITFTGGFITNTAAGGDWGSIVVTDIIPAVDGGGQPIDTVQPLLIFADTGFSNPYTAEATPGESFYVDDICFEMESSVVPSEYRKLWQDDDPLGPDSQENAFLSVTNVNTGPAIDGDHPTAGLVDHSAANKFSSIGGANAPFSIVPGDYGLPYSFSIDYFIPSDTVMDDGDLDLIYVQVNFNSASGGSNGANLAAGFISTSNATLDAWNTITLSGTVPATDDYVGSTTSGPGNDVDEVNAVFIFVDGGFGGTADNAAGTSLFVDNICLEIGTPPVGPPPAPSAPVKINSITYNGATATLNYDTTFDDGGSFTGVDIYSSLDLENWTAVGFVTTVGAGLEIDVNASEDDKYYILVEPGVTPGFGNFGPPPENDITP